MTHDPNYLGALAVLFGSLALVAVLTIGAKGETLPAKVKRLIRRLQARSRPKT